MIFLCVCPSPDIESIPKQLYSKLADRQITTDFMKAGCQWERKELNGDSRERQDPSHGETEIYNEQTLPDSTSHLAMLSLHGIF